MSVEPWAGAPRPPRRWQAEALPVIVASARARHRPLVAAVMGSGKSVLQAELACLALDGARGRAVILSAPRQRLVQQLAATVAERVGSLWSVGRWYAEEKDEKADVVVCCNDSLPSLAVALGERGSALLILDEAHRSEAGGVRAAVEALKPTVLVGFTATPFRSLPKESLSLFDEIAVRYTLTDAIRDGVLVPPRVERWRGDLGVGVDAACLEMIREHGAGPGIVSAATKDDADAYAAWLTGQGVAALSIHSGHAEKLQVERLGMLRAGEVRALVHVALLAEGVDFPWLRWICLRRHVQARVRFLQEIGRVLRIEEGTDKREGLILDPHLLLGRYGLDGPEAFGAALQACADAEARDPAVVARELAEREALALDALTAYLEALRSAMEAAGGCGPRWTDGTGDGWRLAEVSQKQVDRVAGVRKLTRYMPGDYREPVKALLNVPWALTRGQASDLLDVLIQGRAWAQEFRRPWQEDYQAKWSADLGVEVPEMGTCKVVARMKE